MPIVIEVPDSLKPLVEPMRALLKTLQDCVGRVPKEGYVEVERRLAQQASEIEREGHRTVLASLATKAPVLRIDGEGYRRVLVSEGRYFTRVGDVVVERGLYRREGTRTGETVDEVGVRVGALPGGWLPDTAAAMASEVQRGTSREAEVSMGRLHVLPYSRSSFERVAHEVATHLRERQPEIEEALLDELEIPEKATGITASLDRVSVPMEEPRAKPPGRPKKHAPKKPVACVWRMAWCATLTLHDEEGTALHTIRYGNMPGANPRSLVDALAADAHALKQRRPELKVSTLCDGAHDLRALLDEGFPEQLFGKVTRLVDFWHVVERIAAALVVIHGNDGARPVLERMRLLLKNSSSACTRICNELERSGKLHVRVGDEAPVLAAVTYLRNHADLMGYAAARAAGQPIGSGQVEATCKSLFGMRLKRPGARWKEDTGEDVVQLRAAALSDRFDGAMRLALAPLRRTVSVPRRAACSG